MYECVFLRGIVFVCVSVFIELTRGVVYVCVFVYVCDHKDFVDKVALAWQI